MINSRVTFTLVVLAMLCGGAARALADDEPLNKMCPVMTSEEANPNFTLVYEGKKIAFCCDRCMVKFQTDPARYLPNLPQFASAAGFAPAAGAHEEHAPPRQSTPQRTPWLGRIHPLIVHFPLAGIPLALLGFLASIATGRSTLAHADVPPLLLATVLAVAAVITGNIAEDASPFTGDLAAIVERHQFVSTTVMIVALALTALRLWRWPQLDGTWRWAYGVGLVAATALLGYTGFLGGSLVFGPDHLRF